MTSISDARQRGESFTAYLARRKATQAAIRQYLKGRLSHVSSQIVTLPADPTPEQAKQWHEGLSRGHIRDAQTVTLTNGKTVSVARTKGVTYRRPA